MSCFVHHMVRKGIFYDMGIPVSEDDADSVEGKIAGIVGMRGRECHEIWKKVSEWLEDPKLKEDLKNKLSEIYFS
ncbi:MAG: hypothetical protein Q8O75_01800 [bacterium]|nr:hypothetical protein [bacterium]